jgi:hypothetical protein
VKDGEIKLSLFLAEHNVGTHAVDHLIPLVKSAFPDSKISQSMQLGRTKCSEIIKNVIGQQEINELVTYLRVIQFSVLVDETTDIGDIKSMCVLVRFVKNCRVQTQPLELIDLDTKECNAEGLYKQFKTCLVEKHNTPIHNVIGVAPDGASVMIGKHNSFFANLKKEVRDVLLLRCICHSAALIANKACEELPKSQDELLRNVANYISGSAKRSSILQEIQQFLNVEKTKILNFAVTRWLSRHACIVRILNHWGDLTQYFQLVVFEDKLTTAENILSELQN